jgi:hypothetical protein
MPTKKRNGRKRKTLKFRGGDLDDPDTKDFMNSKIEALEQKISELESNIPIQIGWKQIYAGGLGTYIPVFVNRNISVEDFWRYAGRGVSQNHNSGPITTIFLPALYSLPNVRGLNIEECVYGFNSNSDPEDAGYLAQRNVDALNAKYPGLFVK